MRRHIVELVLFFTSLSEYFYICSERGIFKPPCTGKYGFMKSTCLRMSVSKFHIEELLVKNIEIKYHEITDENVWKIDFIKEIINLKEDWLTLHGFGKTQLDEILEHLCTG